MAQTPPDTTHVLGGPDRWDGRFETAAGLPDWHGWTHGDLYDDPEQNHHWRLSDHLPVSGAFSAWCGDWFDNACSDGYGNDWRDGLIFTRAAADTTLATTVRLQCVCDVDTEPGYDHLHVQVRRGTQWQDLRDPMDGDRLFNIDLEFTLEPGDYLVGEWALRFLAASDASWSDEDCLYDSRGHSRVDDIVVIVDGAMVNTEDFEDETSDDWTPQVFPGTGDFTALRQDLDDVDPDPAHHNDSWQVTFIDDGVVVPGTGDTPCQDWCYGPDGWVYNVTGGLTPPGVNVGHPFGWYNGGVWNGVMSPPLAWPELADAGRLEFDVYAHMQTYECGVTAYGWAWRATTQPYPEALDDAPWTATVWSTFADPADMPEGPCYHRVSMDIAGLPPGARWVQVRLEAYEVGPYCWGESVTQGTPAPYFDNVAVLAWNTLTDAPPAAAALALRAAPNPFNPRVVLGWSQPAAGPVELVIFDARGRRVRTLLADRRAAGEGTAAWDGRDDAGAALPAGLYLARLRTQGGDAAVVKVTLVR